MGSKWTFAFSKVSFLTQITLFEKNALTSSRKIFFFGHFRVFLMNLVVFTDLDFVQNRSIYIGKVKGFLPIWVDLYRKNQRIFSENRLIYTWKVWVFRSISIDLYEKRTRILPKLVNLYWKYKRVLTSISRFETLKAKGS